MVHQYQKQGSSFIVFDIESFYPSICEDLFKSTIQLAKESIDFSDYDLSLINQPRKNYYFTKIHPGPKKKATRIFMSLWVVFIGQKCGNLVGIYILNQLKDTFQDHPWAL